MKAGTGAADITPTPGMILQGHWSDTPSHTVLFPLEVRAIVFEQDNTRAAIVTVDAIGVTQAITQRIRARIEHSAGITPACVMVVASHTHCAPAVLALGGSDADEAFAESIIERSVDCVCGAASRLRPVTFGLGCGSVHFNVNRRPFTHDADLKVNEAGVVDRRVRVLRVDDDDSRPVAVLFHYSCHPTTKGGNEGYVSYDYPGIARDVIEQRLQCHALFMPGCFGNVRPAVLDEHGNFTSASIEQLDACGRELGKEVCRVVKGLRATSCDVLDSAIASLAVPLGEPDDRETLERLIANTESSIARAYGQWARRVMKLIDDGAMPRAIQTHMQCTCVGPVAMVAMPGEPVQEIGHAIERHNRGARGCEDIWPMGYTNDMVGYLCTPQQHAVGGYEPNAYKLFGNPARFAGEAQAVIDVAEDLLSNE